MWGLNQSQKHMVFVQGGAPPVVSCFINRSKRRYIYHKHPKTLVIMVRFTTCNTYGFPHFRRSSIVQVAQSPTPKGYDLERRLGVTGRHQRWVLPLFGESNHHEINAS